MAMDSFLGRVLQRKERVDHRGTSFWDWEKRGHKEKEEWLDIPLLVERAIANRRREGTVSKTWDLLLERAQKEPKCALVMAITLKQGGEKKLLAQLVDRLLAEGVYREGSAVDRLVMHLEEQSPLNNVAGSHILLREIALHLLRRSTLDDFCHFIDRLEAAYLHGNFVAIAKFVAREKFVNPSTTEKCGEALSYIEGKVPRGELRPFKKVLWIEERFAEMKVLIMEGKLEGVDRAVNGFISIGQYELAERTAHALIKFGRVTNRTFAAIERTVSAVEDGLRTLGHKSEAENVKHRWREKYLKWRRFQESTQPIEPLSVSSS